ncbi:MAG: hypothetical protein IKP00_17445 [Victivallales bacterium]|nr:hypothetical protein [Victivallales bacterium]
MLSQLEIEKIINLHNEQIAQGKTLRNLKKRQVTRILCDGKRYVVKAYLRRWWHRLFIQAPCKTASVALLEGFTPPCIGDTGKELLWQYTIYEDAGNQDLYAIMRDARLPNGFEQLYASAGELLARVHQKGIYHGDTKPPNFVINTAITALPPVVIVDCDHIIAYNKLPDHRRIFNLAQFIATNDIHPDNLELYPTCMQAFAAQYAKTMSLSLEQLDVLLTKAVQVALSSPRIERRVPQETLFSLFS